jgi:Xaa-Pro aminopeptidase
MQMEIHAIDFAARRKQFLSKIKGGVAVFPAASELIRNNDVTFPYRQDSTFQYLTGFPEPNAWAILSHGSEAPFQMFVQPRDKMKEMWEGKIWGPEAAKSKFGADIALPSFPESNFDEAFVQAMQKAECLYYRIGKNEKADRKIFYLLSVALRKMGRTGRPLWPIRDPDEILGEMRLVKSKGEIDRLERASHISAEAHVNAMRIAKPGMFEYEVEAILYHSFRAGGAGRLGYESIVASGPNACCLHYRNNDRRMGEKDLLLVDAGAEYDYYTSDITRTYPVGGTFTQEQREVYQAVLNAQKECIRMVRPGKTLRDIHARAVEVLTEELRKLKVLKGPSAPLIKKRAYYPFYPHNTGHWLGLDVHDAGPYYTGDYDKARKLEPGMVFTIEPGLYFAPDASSSPARYRGIGVRIEDDILVTSNGCRVLTSGVPKEIDEVESICARG